MTHGIYECGAYWLKHFLNDALAFIEFISVFERNVLRYVWQGHDDFVFGFNTWLFIFFLFYDVGVGHKAP